MLREMTQDAAEAHSLSSVRSSVVIPAYNAAKTLPDALAALHAQNYSGHLEVIVVDDGSTDDMGSIAEAGGARVLRQANRGPASARNLGARNATGDVVLFMDADCVPTSAWVANMLAPFADPAVVGVRGVYRTVQRSIIARFAQAEFEDRYQRQQRSPTIDLIDSSAAAFRRAVFLIAGGFDERFPTANNEDVELSYRLSSEGARLVIAPNAAVYHLHPATLSRYLSVKFGRGYWRTLVYRLYPAKALKDSYTPQVLKLQVVLAGAVLAGLLPALVLPPLRWAITLALAFLLASTLPFTAFVARRDPVVALWTPAIVLLRALALGAGTAAALMGRGKGLSYASAAASTTATTTATGVPA